MENLPDDILENVHEDGKFHKRSLEVNFTKYNMTDLVERIKNNNHWFSPEVEAYLAAAYCVVILLGVCSNGLVFYIIYKFDSLRCPRNMYILNLSLCDILMCVICMPFSLIRLTIKNWAFGEFLCRFVPCLQNVDIFVSVFTVMAIAVDRYRSIVYAQVETPKHSWIYYRIMAIWCVSVFFSLPMAIFHRIEHAGLFTEVCGEDWPSYEVRAAYTVIVMVMLYVGPVFTISTLHVCICRFLQDRLTRRTGSGRSEHSVIRHIKRHRKNIFLLSAIAMTFAVTWLPLTILNLIADYNWKLFLNENFNLVFAICLLLAMSSAFMNPIIYVWFNTSFKTALLEAFPFLSSSSKENSISLEIIASGKDRSRQKSYSSLDSTKSTGAP